MGGELPRVVFDAVDERRFATPQEAEAQGVDSRRVDDAALVADAHSRGLAVNVWTVNADADLAAMVRFGVDAVITDRVVAALAATGRRGRNGGGGVTSSTIEA